MIHFGACRLCKPMAARAMAHPVDGDAAQAPRLDHLVHVQQRLQRRRRPRHLVLLLLLAEVVREGVALHLRARARASVSDTALRIR